jgi:hypothetical protein
MTMSERPIHRSYDSPSERFSAEQVERAAKALFDHFCPMIRMTDDDLTFYRDAVRVVADALGELL